MAADYPAYYNFRQNIYMEALDEVFQSTTELGQASEAEKVYLPPG